MTGDLIIYALIAGGLIVWLRNVLGTRHGDERQRPNPFAEHKESPSKHADNNVISLDNTVSAIQENPSAVHLPDKVSVKDSAGNGINEIARQDRSFDLKTFAQGAQDAFVMIVEAFAKGDTEMLRMLLADDIFKTFKSAIDGRNKRGETMQTDIHALRKCDIENAWISDRKAYITIRFTADETIVIRDQDNEILSGDPDRIYENIDVWTFSRSLKSKNPTWLLVQTKDPDHSGTVSEHSESL